MSRRDQPPRPAPAPPGAAAAAPSRTGWIALGLVFAAVLVALVTNPLYDPDLWQHLLVGKVIWQLRAVPHTQLWAWPVYGTPDVPPSWLFRALLWPWWAVGGLGGLYAWRWFTTLAAFALLWAAAREAGARGPWVPVGLLWCALFFRYRTQVRPDTLVAVLAALQLWLLERRRARGPGSDAIDPAWGLVPVALVWANAHLSYTVGLLLTGIYALDAWLAGTLGRRESRSWPPATRPSPPATRPSPPATRPSPPATRPSPPATRPSPPATRPSPPATRPWPPATLAWVLLACAAVSFVNPFGWKLLAQPFQYWFEWRHEAVYATIGELRPVAWRTYLSSGLPAWLLLAGALALLRWRRSGPDFAQWLVLLVFVPEGLAAQRFLGLAAVLVSPLFARDLDAALGGLTERWPARAAVAVACALLVALPLPSAREPMFAPAMRLDRDAYPVHACDWIATHGVRGRALQPFQWGGYLLWRFWPDRDRLPFMDVHQAGTPLDRGLMGRLNADELAWRELDRERRFDWVLMPRQYSAHDRMLDVLDLDSSFVLVFADDVAALYVRRDGRDSLLASREAYRWVPAGRDLVPAMGALAERDPAAAAAMRAELERQVSASPENGTAHGLLANLALERGDWRDALAELAAARRVRPDLPNLAGRERLARDSLAAAGHGR